VESSCRSSGGSCLLGAGGLLGGCVGAVVPSRRTLMCLLCLFAFFPPNIMLPRFEKDTCVGEVKSSKLPVGMTMSMPWKGDWASPFASSE
jgi:hypothetical protein